MSVNLSLSDKELCKLNDDFAYSAENQLRHWFSAL